MRAGSRGRWMRRARFSERNDGPVRLLGLDIGERRIGVAVSDPSARVATPLAVLDAPSLEADMRPLLRLIEDYEAGLVVVGLPLSMDGTHGPQAARVKVVAARLAERLPVPVEYYDERLSSAEARRTMSAAGTSAKRQKGSVDKVAAAIMLQGYLDAHSRTEGDAPDG